MKISLIIPSRNRSSQLAASLEKLPVEAMRRHGVDLVLVDSASDDDTLARMRVFSSTAPFPVQSVRAQVKGSSIARNLGAHHAPGDLLVFTDDDCYLAEDYFDVIAREFDPNRFKFGAGAILPYDEHADDRMASTTWWPIKQKTRIRPNWVMPVGVVQSANMFFLREVFHRIGGFREDMGIGAPFGGADCELATRASLQGLIGILLPEAKVFHHHQRAREGAAAERVMEYYDRGRGAYYAWLLARGEKEAWNLWKNFPLAHRTHKERLLRELRGAADFLEHLLSKQTDERNS